MGYVYICPKSNMMRTSHGFLNLEDMLESWDYLKICIRYNLFLLRLELTDGLGQNLDSNFWPIDFKVAQTDPAGDYLDQMSLPDDRTLKDRVDGYSLKQTIFNPF